MSVNPINIEIRWLVVLCAGLLLSMLFFPFGYDQSVFAVGGEMLFKNNATSYKDIIDTKPPAIFYIYGFSSFVFGYHEVSIRIVDVVWQSLTALLLYTILRVRFSKNVSIWSVTIYVLYYTSSGYWRTAQTESFALLPTLGIVYYFNKIYIEKTCSLRKVIKYGSISGILLALILFIKPTLIISFCGVIAYSLFNTINRFRSLTVYLSTVLVVLGLVICIYAIYLWQTDILQYFLLVNKWLLGYGGLSNILSYEGIRSGIFVDFSSQLAVTLSLVILLSIPIGIYLISQEKENKNSNVVGLPFLLWQVFFGIIGVILEQKYFGYHFTRFFWACTPFIATTTIFSIERINKMLADSRSETVIQKIKTRTLVLILVVPLLVYTPIVRVFSQNIRWTWYNIFDRSSILKAKQSLDKDNTEDFNHLLKKVPNLAGFKNVFLWGNTMEVYLLLGTYPRVSALTNSPFVAPWSPQELKNNLLADLKDNPPDLFIVEKNDRHPTRNKTNYDSWEYLLQWKQLNEFLITRYHKEYEVTNFVVFVKD